MIGRARHLHDDRLFEIYLADTAGEPLDPPSADHLADCDGCRARYADLVAFLGNVRAEADAETDELFAPDRLHHQQEQILRRIEHLNHSARVISFPGRQTSQLASGSGRVAPRWLAAAAAAGLFVGVAVGGTLLQPTLRELPGMRVAGGPSTAARMVPAPPVRVNASPVADTFDDDLFLMELEFALERPHTQELQPFDALTPHVQEIGVQEIGTGYR